MGFALNTRSRCWIVTVQIANMENSGLSKGEYENPEYLAKYFVSLWEDSGKGRKAGIAVCVSNKGLYHAHMACYGNTTTLKKVSEILYHAHVEPQLGGKEVLKEYLLKEGKYKEKGEQVLCWQGLDLIQDNQGKRSDLDEIEEMLVNGATPEEIFNVSFRYRKYEKMVRATFIDKRIKETPLIKKTHNEWHVGESGSGKTYYYYKLCEKYTQEKVYMITDYDNGGFDFYVDQGAPPIIFMDEFKGEIRYGQLLTILDKYSRTQTHCRFTNTYNLWTTCIITSIYPPDEIYASMVDNDKKERDKIEQLLRRLDLIVYHYKQNGKYKMFSMSADEYKGYEDLKQRALGDENGFIKLDDTKNIPFNE